MPRRHSRVLTLLFLTLAVGAAGCGAKTESAGSRTGKPKVVATFSVLGDLVRNVAGDRVEIITLVGPDGDTHTFEPTPKDVVTLAEAGLVFENGAGLEPWLDGLFSSSKSKARRVAVSGGLKLIEADDDHEHDHGHHSGKKDAHEHEHQHEDHDPHVWHDVQNVIQMIPMIRDSLVQLDPGGAEAFKANADAYLKQLNELDAWVVGQVAALPPGDRKLVTNHDTFGYFARRYGFEVVGTALGSLSTETADPSAADLAKLSESIKATKVRAIFAENVNNPKVMQRLASEAGVKLAPPLYTDALGPVDGEGGTYVKMIRHNVTTIVTQLK